MPYDWLALVLRKICGRDAPRRLRIATRSSPLALWQAAAVGRLLSQAHPGLATAAAARSSAAWASASAGRSSGVQRQRISGSRLIVPTPEQGASTSTRSKTGANGNVLRASRRTTRTLRQPQPASTETVVETAVDESDDDSDEVIDEIDPDGHADLVCTGRDGLRVFHGGPDGLRPDRCTFLPGRGQFFHYVQVGDFDHDGWLDLLAVNGLVVESLDRAASGALFPLDQRNQLFRNRGDGGFEDVSLAAGAVFQLSEVSRGTAFGDVDNDGDTDVLVSNASGPVRLLINRIGQLRHWIGLRLVGVGGRDMVGTRVAVIQSDGTTLWRRARADGSYASASDPRVLVGLGSAADPVDVRVIWPDGRVEEWRALPVGRYTTLTEGTGRGPRIAGS